MGSRFYVLFILFVFKLGDLEVGTIFVPLTKTEDSVGTADMGTKRTH